MGSPLPIAVFASGEGTTLDALARAAGDYRIVLVVVDRPGVGALEVARRHGLPAIEVGRPRTQAEAWAARITRELEARGVALVVLAGFLSILPPSWAERWAGRAINTHPSLLPRFGGRGMYGLRVHAAVIASGATESGATVHLVTEATDAGPTIAQARVPVLPGDSPEVLRDRIHPVEIELLIGTIRAFATGARPLPYPGERAADRGP